MAKPQDVTPPAASSELQQYKDLTNMLNTQIDTLKSPAWQKYQAYQVSRYDEEIAMSQHRISVFKWQEFASDVMLWVVVVVVMAGVTFSGAQLWHALRFDKVAPETGFEAGVQGLKITSSVVGLTILAMSLAFVIIFVQDIYAVKAIDLGTSAQVAAAPK